MNAPDFNGHRWPERHLSYGRRANCECGGWCYPNGPCACCREQLANEHRCQTCEGRGYLIPEEDTPQRPGFWTEAEIASIEERARRRVDGLRGLIEEDTP